MLDCLIVGDSIGVHLSRYLRKCDAVVESGITSGNWDRKYPNKLVKKTVIVSLGSNDWNSVETVQALRRINKRIYADKVFFILPVREDKQAGVVTAVKEKGATLVTFTHVMQDKIHPSTHGIYEIISQIKGQE